jgi:hypothetical protein
MILYHVTSKENYESIRRGGFRDTQRSLGRDDAGRKVSVRGVWFSDKPWLDGACVEVANLPDDLDVLLIDIPDAVASQFEVVTEGSPYREWCIRAAVANQHLR